MAGGRTSEHAATHLLRKAARFPLLTPAQEVSLGRAIRAWQDWPDGPSLAPLRIRTTGKRALDRFVLSNIKLAIKTARRFEGKGVELDDLIQSALEGLIEACKRFNPNLGYRSSGYTIWWLRLYCKQAITQQGRAIHLPQQVLDLVARVHTTQRAHQQQHGRPASDAELAGLLEIPVERLRHTLELVAGARVSSLDQMIAGGDGTGCDHLAALGVHDPEPGPDVWSTRARLREGIATIESLPVRAVMELIHLGDDPLSPVRIARMLNLRPRDVRAMEDEGLALLRAQLPIEHLELIAA